MKLGQLLAVIGPVGAGKVKLSKFVNRTLQIIVFPDIPDPRHPGRAAFEFRHVKSERQLILRSPRAVVICWIS